MITVTDKTKASRTPTGLKTSPRAQLSLHFPLKININAKGEDLQRLQLILIRNGNQADKKFFWTSVFYRTYRVLQNSSLFLLYVPNNNPPFHKKFENQVMEGITAPVSKLLWNHFLPFDFLVLKGATLDIVNSSSLLITKCILQNHDRYPQFPLFFNFF